MVNDIPSCHMLFLVACMSQVTVHSSAFMGIKNNLCFSHWIRVERTEMCVFAVDVCNSCSVCVCGSVSS